MEKHELLDKIDKIREIVDGVGDSNNIDVDDILIAIDELKIDTEMLLEDEYDAGYELGLNRSENLKEE